MMLTVAPLLLVIASIVYGYEKTWKFTRVREALVNNSMQLSLPLPWISATAYASRLGTYRLVCEISQDESWLLNIFAVPFNEELVPGPKYNCQTNRNPANILTAQSGISVYANTPQSGGNPLRKPSNLLDGVYTGDPEECFMSKPANNPYIVFNLTRTAAVRNVVMVSISDSGKEDSFQNMDIRVGTAPKTGNFSSYEQLAYMDGMAPHPSYEYTSNATKPIIGNFLSIQAYATYIKLIICHLEIYVV
ncbi:uncharacterized protein LOC125179141 [Hyalella azteca]|uniref:Uncharacterized protein LOC125179141 n=1 Tax=Hyalella azteca TaxID=294128 RepID=A0A979FT30_HYAAZ|nr:uncharacterized protein LOC125179141 [Hyalella azteca]